MKIEELIKIFNEILNEDGNNEITVQTDFKEDEKWSSLTAFTIVSELEEKYNIQLRGIELRRCTTVEDLLILINIKSYDFGEFFRFFSRPYFKQCVLY